MLLIGLISNKIPSLASFSLLVSDSYLLLQGMDQHTLLLFYLISTH